MKASRLHPESRQVCQRVDRPTAHAKHDRSHPVFCASAPTFDALKRFESCAAAVYCGFGATVCPWAALGRDVFDNGLNGCMVITDSARLNASHI